MKTKKENQHDSIIKETSSVQEKDLPVVEKEVSKDEVGGRKGPEPTRYGDWEKKGKCIDF